MSDVRYAAALSQHPVPVEAVGEVVGSAIEAMQGVPVDLATLFVSPHHVGALEDVVATVRALVAPRVLLGTTAAAVIGGAREVENGPAIALLTASLPDATLTPVALGVERTPDGPAVMGWPDGDHSGATLLLLADPFTFPGDAFLARLDREYKGLAVVGGLASAARGPGGNRLVLDDRLATDGAVGVIVDGGITVHTVVSQGCRPIGAPYVVTRAEGNVVHELAGRPAVERLAGVAEALSEAERDLLRSGLHVGLVVDEHRSEFGRGDFLVRNVVGIDRASGAVAVGELIDVGQTLQFHVRDAASADEDLRQLLAGVDADAGLLFTCNGRGTHLFGEADHDASVVDTLLGPLPVAGMFCAGELGPVGGRNFVHGFTASLALFGA